MSTRVFPLAPMSIGVRVLTWSLFFLPVAFAVSALERSERSERSDFLLSAPSIVKALLYGSTLLIVLIYVSVWLVGRPSRFELDDDTLRIVWPLRTRSIARSDVLNASVITAEEFRNEYGYGMRIGAGGLWGAFGLFVTSRETFSIWTSRTDSFVMVRLQSARTLLISPEEPEQFVDSLQAIKASPSA